MYEYEVVIKEIPEHVVYYKDYWASNHLFFLDAKTGENYLQTLSDKVMDENPGIQLTDPDYNYFLYPDGWFEDGSTHIQFCDRVTESGIDTEEYRFCRMAGITAVCVFHEGPFEQLEKTHAFATDWIREHQYSVCGYPRDSFIHGFWDRDDPRKYLTEVQIPVNRLKSA